MYSSELMPIISYAIDTQYTQQPVDLSWIPGSLTNRLLLNYGEISCQCRPNQKVSTNRAPFCVICLTWRRHLYDECQLINNVESTVKNSHKSRGPTGVMATSTQTSLLYHVIGALEFDRWTVTNRYNDVGTGQLQSYDTIRYDTMNLHALKSWPYGQLSLAHGTETKKTKEKLKTKTD